MLTIQELAFNASREAWEASQRAWASHQQDELVLNVPGVRPAVQAAVAEVTPLINELVRDAVKKATAGWTADDWAALKPGGSGPLTTNADQPDVRNVAPQAIDWPAIEREQNPRYRPRPAGVTANATAEEPEATDADLDRAFGKNPLTLNAGEYMSAADLDALFPAEVTTNAGDVAGMTPAATDWEAVVAWQKRNKV